MILDILLANTLLLKRILIHWKGKEVRNYSFSEAGGNYYPIIDITTDHVVLRIPIEFS